MRRALLLPLLVALVACSKQAAKEPDAKRIALVVADLGRPVGDTVIVDDGAALHVLPTPAKVKDGLAIPKADAGVSLGELAATLDALDVPQSAAEDEQLPAVPVVIAPAAPAVRALAIADALWASGRCLGAVGAYRDGLVVIGNACHRYFGPATDQVTLTVLVNPAEIWVGLSRINEYQPIPKLPSGEPDWPKLEVTLNEHKRSAFFADRVDLQITADPAVTYGHLATAAMIADKVGFTAIRFVSAANAAAIPTL